MDTTASSQEDVNEVTQKMGTPEEALEVMEASPSELRIPQLTLNDADLPPAGNNLPDEAPEDSHLPPVPFQRTHRRSGETPPEERKTWYYGPFELTRPLEDHTPAEVAELQNRVIRPADRIRYASRNFGRQTNPPRTNNPNQPPSRANTSSPSAYSPSATVPPNIPPSPSPSLSATMSVNDQAHHSNQAPPRNPPFFFREEYTGFIVRGNFATLATKPLLVELGEWLGHQIVEQNRLLDIMVKSVSMDDRTTGRAVCNEVSCPSMSAGVTTYTWIDTSRNPINIPAMTYIKHIQTWIAGKIQNEAIFPVAVHERAPPLPSPQQLAADPNGWLGKTSGFPQNFEMEIKNMYKQMFRCYAHLYWSHWLDYWHLSGHKDLNTCFMHFINVGRLYNLLTDADMEPMQPLIDIWIRGKHLPQLDSAEKSTSTSGQSATVATTGASSSATSTTSSAANAAANAAVNSAPGSAA